MRYWTFCEPYYPSQDNDGYEDMEYTYSEGDILEEYWDWWSSEMVRLGRHSLISSQNCIDDWVVTHWACLSNADGSTILADPK